MPSMLRALDSQPRRRRGFMRGAFSFGRAFEGTILPGSRAESVGGSRAGA